jgi:hypothetical protein
MKLLRIEDRVITLELDAEDARRIALACREAAPCVYSDQTASPQAGASAMAYFESVAVALESACMAATAWSYTDGVRSDMPDFTLENLRADKIGGPLW